MNFDLLNKKKKLLAYAIATSLSIPALSSCGTNYFDYKVEENGDLLVEGTITFDKFKKLKLIHLTNEIALIDKYIIVEEKEYLQRYTSSKLVYVDMENGKIVYNSKDDDFKNFNLEIVVDRLIDYMYKYDMVKDNYDIEDIKRIKEYLLLDETLNIGKDNLEEENIQEEVRVLKKRRKYC